MISINPVEFLITYPALLFIHSMVVKINISLITRL